jgi:hypothetical protein
MKFLAVILALAPLTAAQILHYELDAPAGITHYGQAVAVMPDLDSDGRPDFALSAYGQRVDSPDSQVRVGVTALKQDFFSIGRLVVGLQTQFLPLAGGVLVPEPQLSVWFVNMPEDVPLALNLPASLPSGLAFWVQLGLVEPDGSITLSDAWKGELP